MKTIGVLGGVGPQATIDFEARLHLVSQTRIPQKHNSGYPPLVVYYHRHPPMVMTADGIAEVPFRADPRLLDAPRRIGPLAASLTMPSHGTHRCRTDIERASGREVLSIIDVTVAEVRRRGWRPSGSWPTASQSSTPARWASWGSPARSWTPPHAVGWTTRSWA